MSHFSPFVKNWPIGELPWIEKSYFAGHLTKSPLFIYLFIYFFQAAMWEWFYRAFWSTRSYSVPSGGHVHSLYTSDCGRQDTWHAFYTSPSSLQVVITTIVFGMEVEYLDVRQVIHWGVPDDAEKYVQETGKAGRDSLPSCALLFYGNPMRHTSKHEETLY